MYTFEFKSFSEENTKEFAKKLARIAKLKDVFLLKGTLGMGKSTLARAFIQELANITEVPSPTFTLLQTYETPDFDIYHFDLYRLKSAEEIFEIGMEDAIYGGVSLIEWPEKMERYIPKDVFAVNISGLGEDSRLFSITVSSNDKKQRLEALKEVIYV